jgi:hypothetical protein
MAAPIVRLPTARGPAGHSLGGTSLGILGVCGLVVEYKHGIEAITEPFAGCVRFTDCYHTVLNLNDATLVGIVAWMGMLFVATIAIVVATTKMVRAAFRQIAWRNRAARKKPNRQQA